MRLMQPLPAGTLEGAAAHLEVAQRIAGSLVSTQSAENVAQVDAGIHSAKLAAAELFHAEPRSRFQDLVAARQQALEGARLLGEARDAFYQELPGDLAMDNVRRIALDAFNAFENAFEIIYND